MECDRVYLKAKSAAALADISTRKLYYLVAQGKLPRPCDLDGMKRWRRDELVAALERLAQPVGEGGA